MRKVLKGFFLAFIFLFLFIVTTSCDSNNQNSSNPIQESYTVTWVVDGKTVEVDNNVAEGTMPTYDGAEPTKEDNYYYYTFTGWSPSVTKVTHDVTYTASFDTKVKEFSVKFEIYDSQIISQEYYKYGQEITIPDNPSGYIKDNEYYAFVGWDKTDRVCEGDATYKAIYEKTGVKYYTVVFADYDNNVISEHVYEGGAKIVAPSDPQRPSSNTFEYSFLGWYADTELTSDTVATKDITYTARYKSIEKTYQIVWKNYDGSILLTKEYKYGETPLYDLDVPTRESKEYQYVFIGWDRLEETVKADATYIAQFQESPKKYLVTFVDYDDTVISSKYYDYNATVMVPNSPTRVSDETYIYTFKSWDAPITSVISNATYKALYDATYIEYEIKFLNYDNTVISTKNYHYGDTVVIPNNPTKESDNTYNYVFKNWSSNVTTVKSNAIYKAVYESQYIDYEIKFLNYDNTILSTKLYHYDETIVAPNDPTKEDDNTYTYAFSGWDKEIQNTVKHSENYVATYSSTYKEYVIEFMVDNTIISSKTYHYGDVVEIPADPTKDPTDRYNYTFKYWDNDITNVYSSATYHAIFDEKLNVFSYLVYEYDGITVLAGGYAEYGSLVKLPTSSIKPTDQYTYYFNGWIDGNGETLTMENEIYIYEDMLIYRNVYSVLNKYTVTWKNYDGTEIASKVYNYGEMPVYTFSTPEKERTTDVVYVFDGWNKPIESVEGNTTYIATFTEKNASLEFGLNDDESGYFVTSIGTIISDTVTIPSEYNSLPVVGIANNAFKSVDFMTTIKLPDTIKTIDEYAFAYCNKLKSIELPNSVTDIYDYAFIGCSSLESVKLSENIQTIGSNSFNDCSSLYSITIPDSLTSIDNSAFYNTPIKKATVSTVALNAINNYNLEELTITSGTEIGEYALSYCDNLTTIVVANTVTSIDSTAFNGTYVKYVTGSTYVINNIPNTCFIDVTITSGDKIEDYTFTGCTTLNQITYPDTLKTIGVGAFYNCTFESFTIPNTVTTIESQAFADCFNLLSVTIPSSVISIESDAFNQCFRLAEVFNFSYATLKANAEIIHSNPDDKSALVIENDYVFCYAYSKGFLVAYLGNEKELSLPTSFTYKGTEINSYTIRQYAFYNMNINTVTIPDNVTCIENNAFMYSKLKVVNNSTKVTSIGDYAFQGCNNLENINISSNLKQLGSNVFYECINLKFNTLNNANYLGDDDNPYVILVSAINKNITECIINENCKFIHDSAFEDCSLMEIIEIPNGIISVGSGAFVRCEVKKAKLPASLLTEMSTYYLEEVDIISGTSLDTYAFFNSVYLTKVTLPETLISIGYQAFTNCTSLKSISIPNSVTDIYSDAFYNCNIEYLKCPVGLIKHFRNSSLKEVEFTSGEIIEEAALLYASGLEKITISNTITKIDDSAFYGCSSLESIIIPDSVLSIGGAAFTSCTSLKDVVLPANLEVCNNYPFQNCTSLNNIYYNGTIEKWSQINFNSSNANPLNYTKNFYIKTENGTVEYGNNKYDFVTDIVIPASIESISNYAFYGMKGIKSVTISNGVKNVGAYSFYGLSEIESIIIPESVERVEGNAFYNCTSVKELIINSDGYIDDFAFPYLPIVIGKMPKDVYDNITKDYVKDLTITSGDLTDIAFSIMPVVEKITISGSITTIPTSAFTSNKTLKEVVLEDGVTELAYGCFSNCSKLEKISLPNSITTIGTYAFYSCESLKSITLPANLTVIGDSFFAFNESLTSIVIPSKVTAIGDYAFYETSISTITIPDSVKTIGSNAFCRCFKLEEVSLSNYLEEIDISAFAYCYMLKEIEIPDSLTSISYEAFTKTYIQKATIPSIACKAINNPYLEEVVITSGTSIPESSLSFCHSLRKIILPNTIETIGYNALGGASSLTSITIPSSVKIISKLSFENCYSLVEIYNLSTINISCGSDENGHIGLYAKAIHTSLDEESILVEDSQGYVFAYVENKGYLVGYNGKSHNLVLPQEFSFNNTTISSYEINYGAISYNNDVRTLTIPDSVTKIWNSAFERCLNLLSITIPSSVTEIEQNAFDLCYKLVEIYNLSNIDIKLSNNNLSIGSISPVIHKSITEKSIITYAENNYAFAYVNGKGYLVDYLGNDASLTLPASFQYDNLTITSYELLTHAFNQKYFITQVDMPDSIISIGDYAFGNCTYLANISMSNNIERIGESVFNETMIICTSYKGCSYLGNADNPYLVLYRWEYTISPIETIEIADGCRVIVNLAFSSSSIKYINIPDGLIYIGTSAFTNSSNLTSVTLPDSVKYIGAYAFNYCSSLESINIPSSITALETGIFANCAALSDIIIPENITEIKDSAFSACTSLKNITIPQTITSIGSGAFDSCTTFTEIIIPDSVTSIGSNAFRNCTSATYLKIGDGLSYLGNQAFQGCSFKKAIIPLVGDLKFNCENLEELIITRGTEISSWQFADATKLTSLVIPNSVTTIGERAFSSCSSLESLVIPNSVITIGEAAFMFGAKLKYVIVSDNLQNVGTGIFAHSEIETAIIPGILLPEFMTQKSLKEVEVTTEITSIAESQFADCLNLKKVILPDTITIINQYAFYNCKSLTEIHMPANLVTISENAFDLCVTLYSIVIPANVTSIKTGAFHNCHRLVEIYNLSNLNINLSSLSFSYGVYNTLVVHNSLDDETIIEKNDDYVYAYYNNEGYIIDYRGNEEKITLPDSIVVKGNTLTSYRIHAYAFNSCEAKEITLSDSIHAIGSGSFSGCQALQNIHLSENLTNIGSNAFRGCQSLTSIVIPSKVDTIGSEAFTYCERLVEIYNLSSLAITKGSYDNGQVAYRAKAVHSSLDEASILVRDKNDYVFAYVDNKGYLIAYFGNEENLVLPTTFTYGETVVDSYIIAELAFVNSTMKSVEIISGATIIDHHAFLECFKLTHVAIRASVQKIVVGAFQDCPLINIYLPLSLTTLQSAFTNCPDTMTVYYEGTKEEWQQNVTKTNGWDTPSSSQIQIEVIFEATLD